MVDVETERNLAMRILLHSPKDTLAGLVAVAAITAIVANALFLQTGRRPAPMLGTLSQKAAETEARTQRERGRRTGEKKGAERRGTTRKNP